MTVSHGIKPSKFHSSLGGFIVAGANPDRRHADPAADVPEGQGCGETLDPLLLDVLLDEKGLDGRSRIAAAGLDHGRDVGLHVVRVAYGLNLIGHHHLP